MRFAKRLIPVRTLASNGRPRSAAHAASGRPTDDSMILRGRAERGRVVYVTGKGGAGKSFVAGLLARTASRLGQRVALVEMSEGEPEGPGRVDEDQYGPSLITLDQRHAMRHLLKRLLKLRILTNRLMDSRTFATVAAAAPGVRDLLYVSYLHDMAAGTAGAKWDLIVVDGFASGHTRALLTAPRRVLDLVRLGPAARLARQAVELVEDASKLTAVVVTTPEELCISETVSLLSELRDLEVTVASVVVNGVYPARLNPEQAAWLRASGASADALLHLHRRERQLALAETLHAHVDATFVLPHLFDGHQVDHRAAERLLAAVLGEASP